MEQSLEKLRKSILFGEEIIKVLEKEPDLEFEQKIVISLYRKLLEHSCGGFSLAAYSIGGSLKIIERAAFETYLSLKYMLQKKKFIQDRAYSYYVGFLKNLQTEITDWRQYYEVDALLNEDLERDMNHISNILERPLLERVLNEWDETKIKINKIRNTNYNPKWYSLFNGPQSIHGLVNRLEKEKDIIKDEKHLLFVYYGSLSQEAHAYDALKGTNHLRLLDQPLSLKPLIHINHNNDLDPIIGYCLGGTAEIISYISPQYKNAYLNLREEIK